MMRTTIRLSYLGLLLGAVAACSDLPTSPSVEPAAQLAMTQGAVYADGWAETQGCVLNGLCTLPPIVVDGGGCDPWLDLNWCQGGGEQCMESIGPSGSEFVGLASCPIRGPGGGGSGGGGTLPPPNGGTEPLPSPADDLITQDLPNCAAPTTWTAEWHGPYCNGSAPTGSKLSAFNSELDAMSAQGGICATLAQYGRTLLSQGRVRYYGAGAPWVSSWTIVL